MNYEWDFKAWVTDLLPVKYRNEKTIDFLLALLRPLLSVKVLFDAHRQLVTNEFSQSVVSVVTMRHWLNKEFDPIQQRIQIIDGVNILPNNKLYFFDEVPDEEHPKGYFFTEIPPNQPIKRYFFSEIDAQPDFVVVLPLGVTPSVALTAFVEKLKLPGFSWAYQLNGIQ